MKLNTFFRVITLMCGSCTVVPATHAAISLDRTRVVFDGINRSVSSVLRNRNSNLPYLAQVWIEDEKGHKVDKPLGVAPPVQRIEPQSESQVKIQLTGGTPLPQDKETLYYFNVREIPPKSNKPNTLQIALQTRVKLFYRPAALVIKKGEIPQKALTLTPAGDHIVVNNPTGYYITLIHAAPAVKAGDASGFKADMVAPKSSMNLPVRPTALGSHPVLTYIDDYGGRPKLLFNCNAKDCEVAETLHG